MKTFLRVFAIILLVFLGIGGIYGSVMLISDPRMLNLDFFVPQLHYPFYILGLLMVIAGFFLLRMHRNTIRHHI